MTQNQVCPKEREVIGNVCTCNLLRVSTFKDQLDASRRHEFAFDEQRATFIVRTGERANERVRERERQKDREKEREEGKKEREMYVYTFCT